MSALLSDQPIDILDQLPPKVRVPFLTLRDRNLISDQDLETLCLVGELSGKPHHLIGFAVAMRSLEKQGVHVHDTVKMAKTHQRKINLFWSASRWKEEHNKLSRLATLKEMAADVVYYDIDSYRNFLPKRFAGYLIPTNRRLGMEGLRQSHCVASYSQRIIRGECAIAVVFVDHVRWTVQLSLTGDSEKSLLIVSIKAMHNRVPSDKEKRGIYEVLGIVIPDVSKETPTVLGQDDISLWESNLRRILPILAAAGVGRVDVEFDGGGDSGSIDTINFYDEDNNNVTVNERISIEIYSRTFVNRSWQVAVIEQENSLVDAITEIVDDYLDATGVDWYNNEGGFGHFYIYVQQGTFESSVYVRFAESSCERSEERDIMTGEDL